MYLALGRAVAAGLLAMAGHAAAQETDQASRRAAETEAQMTDDERGALVIGYLPAERNGLPPPEGARPGAGMVLGVPRLGVPPLWETDASLGVSWAGGDRGNGGTQLPSGTAQGATWNTELIERGGAMIGSEARSKGYNLMLAGGINLMREPRSGRTFEYLGEDPLHSGLLGGAAVRGIQSNRLISTLKHFAINPQETGRAFMNVDISEAALRESDLLAFQIAIEKGDPGAIMCAYNAVLGDMSCGSSFILTDVLRRDWGYQGFVMSDWGAVDAMDYALAGLDQQSGSQIDPEPFFGEQLLEAAKSDPAYRERLGEMARRVLWAIYDNGLDGNLPVISEVDSAANSEVALEVAREGIVLLQNEGGILPLSPDVKSVAVIGGHADTGTMIGGGSSRVLPDGGAAAMIPFDRTNPAFGAFTDIAFNGASPLAAIKAAAPGAKVSFRNGAYMSEAAAVAARSDIAIVFATQYQTEGFDVPDLSLPNGQDALIAAVAAANPNTVVVLQTGGPVTMPWKDDVKAILEAWYPGARGGEAIADILFGNVNPSGHLPITFPQSAGQLPRPVLDALDSIEPNFVGLGAPGQELEVDYDIEGSDIGYRWFAREGLEPLFPFGHGLSYTRFEYGPLEYLGGEIGSVSLGGEPDGKGGMVPPLELRWGAGGSGRFKFRIANVGDRKGADVPQIYLVSVNGQPRRRLLAFTKAELEPGRYAEAYMPYDPRLLAEWEDGGWTVAPGTYEFALGHSATELGARIAVELPGDRLDAHGNRLNGEKGDGQ